jgi:hypothetical protein
MTPGTTRATGTPGRAAGPAHAGGDLAGGDAMRRWAAIGAALVGVGVVGAAAVAAGTRRWNRETARAVRRLALPETASTGAPRTYDPAQLAGLPAPVARYLAFALQPGQPLVRRARVEHTGEFQAGAGRWQPFTSVEHFVVRPPGFVWDAAIRAAPLVAVRVRDGYWNGEGSMRAAVAALVPVADQRGTPEMAEASLQRYLAEAPWVPTALLPSAGVRWTAVDDTVARATLVDGDVTASVDFHFGASGEILRVSAVRWRDVRGTPVATPWVARSWDYRRLGGMMVPTAGDVEWRPPEGPMPYWRGRVARAEYEVM